MINFDPSTCFLVMPVPQKRFWAKIKQLESNHTLPSLIFDLEDGVSPKFKVHSRNVLLEQIALLSSLQVCDKRRELFLRINKVGTPDFYDDLVLLKNLYSANCSIGVVIPKVESRSELDTFFSALEFTPSRLFIAIETRKGLCNADEILSSPHLHYCTVGLEDLTAEMEICRPLNFYSDSILSTIVCDISYKALKNNVKCIAPLWPFINFPELLPSYIEEIKGDLSNHMSGIVIFHPYQIEYAQFFWSNKALLDGYHKATIHRKEQLFSQIEKEPSACSVFDFKMVDLPELKRKVKND